MALAQHGALAILTGCRPCLTFLQLSCLAPFPCNRHKQFKRGLRVRDDTEIGIKYAPDLCRLDIDMHEAAALGVSLDRTGMPISPAIADAEDKIGFEHRRVTVTVAGLKADHSGHQDMIVRDCAPAHKRWHHRNIDDLGKRHEKVRRIGIDHTTACDDQRPLGSIEHLKRFLDLLAGGFRFINRQRLIGLVVEFNLGELHIEWQVDQHRAGAARAHDVKCLAKHTRHQCRFAHRDGPFGHGLGDGFDVDGLEVFLVDARAGGLSGDAEDRNRVRDSRIQTGDHVGSGRAGCSDAYADVARLGARVTLSHVRSAFDMARKDVIDRSALLQRRIQRIDRSAGNPERAGDTFLLENTHCRIDCSHLRHVTPRMFRFERDHHDERGQSQRSWICFPRCDGRAKFFREIKQLERRSGEIRRRVN